MALRICGVIILGLAIGIAIVAIYSRLPHKSKRDPTPEASEDLSRTIAVDPQAKLNSAWHDKFDRISVNVGPIADAPLSGSGYPIILTRRVVAVCSDPTQVQLAGDLVLAKRLSDAQQVRSCVVLQPDQDAEWTQSNPFNNGLVAIRVHRRTKLPQTYYGPTPHGNDQPFYAWFGTLSK